MLKKIHILLMLVLLSATQILAEEKIPIAIMELQPIDVQANTARAVTDLIRTELFNTGLFRVFERGEIEKVLKEQQFGQTGLTEVSDAVRLGKMLQAKKVLVGTVSKLGTSYIVNARIIDVEKGEMEFADKAQADSETALVQAVETFARKIAGRIQASTGSQQSSQQTTKPVKPAKEKKQVVRTEKSTSSGGGSLRTPSIILMASGAVVGASSLLFQMNAQNAYDDYRSITTPEANFEEAWDKVDQGILMRNISLIGGGALLATGVVLFIVDAKGSGNSAKADRPSTRFAYLPGMDSQTITYTMRW